MIKFHTLHNTIYIEGRNVQGRTVKGPERLEAGLVKDRNVWQRKINNHHFVSSATGKRPVSGIFLLFYSNMSKIVNRFQKKNSRKKISSNLWIWLIAEFCPRSFTTRHLNGLSFWHRKVTQLNRSSWLKVITNQFVIGATFTYSNATQSFHVHICPCFKLKLLWETL